MTSEHAVWMVVRSATAGLGLGAMAPSLDRPMHRRSADLFEVRLEREFEPGHFVLFRRKGQPFEAAAQALADTMLNG